MRPSFTRCKETFLMLMGEPTNPLSPPPRDAGGLAVAFGSSYFCSREQIASCPSLPPKSEPYRHSTYQLPKDSPLFSLYPGLFPVEYSTLLLKLLLFIGLFLILKSFFGGSTPGPSMSGIPVHAPEAGGAIHRSFFEFPNFPLRVHWLALYPQEIHHNSQPKGAMDTAEIEKIEPPGMRNAIKQTSSLPPSVFSQKAENRWLSCEGQRWLARTEVRTLPFKLPILLAEGKEPQ